jgi:hypothetical protein
MINSVNQKFGKTLRLIFLVQLAIFISFGSAPAQAATQLSPAEVREVFIGTPWHNDKGAFLFKKDGTYTYQEFNKSKPRGVWEYHMLESGALDGESTRYTFYRRKNGKYFYIHSRTNKAYRAYPNKTFP